MTELTTTWYPAGNVTLAPVVVIKLFVTLFPPSVSPIQRFFVSLRGKSSGNGLGNLPSSKSLKNESWKLLPPPGRATDSATT